MEDTSGTVDVRQYLALLWRWLWLIALVTLVAAGTAFGASKRAIPIYEASTTMLINEGRAVSGPDYNDVLLSERLASSYAQMLRSRPILRTAATQLALPLDGQGLAELAEAVSVEPVRDTQIVRLKVRHANPELAAAIANEIPQAFRADNQSKQAARYASAKESLLREMISLEATIAAVQAALDAERAKPEPNSSEISRLETLVTQHRVTYAGLLQSYEDIRLAEATGTDSLVVIEPAEAPLQPVLPRTASNTLLAGLVGAMLAAGVALVIENLDDTVKRPDDLEQAAHLPALATIGRFPRSFAGNSAQLVAAEPRSAMAEAYRVLRTNLKFAIWPKGSAGDGGGVILLVTSARPREGKTATVANLGVSLAQTRKRVLLVDADLRRPSLHTYFGLGNRVGLTSLLLRPRRDFQSAVQSSGRPRLGVLTSGRTPVNPAEVLSFPGGEAFYDQLRSLADYIIIDSPPALSVTDPLILAQNVDGVLVVAEAGKTRRDALRAAVAALEGSRAPLLGVVLNKASSRATSYYRDKRYYGRRRERRTMAAGLGRRVVLTGSRALQVLFSLGSAALCQARRLVAMRYRRRERLSASVREIGTTGEPLTATEQLGVSNVDVISRRPPDA